MYTNIDTTRLLKAIRGTNAYFHLHKESDKAFKNQFYKIKDSIVKEILTNNIELGIDYSLNGTFIDATGNTYVLVEFNNGVVDISVHVPIRVCPSILSDVSGEYNQYVRNENAYVEFDIPEDEFINEFTYLVKVFKNGIHGKKVNEMKDFMILNYIKSTAGKVGIRPTLDQHDNYMHFKTKKRNRLLYSVEMNTLRKAIKETMTFNYVALYRYMTSQGIIKPIKM